jgi:putative hydrolase of the HAD superfamily
MAEFSDIRAVSLDMGGTLIDPWPSVGHAYAEVARRHGVTNLSADELDRRFAMAWQAHSGFDYTRAGWAAVVDATFAGLTPEPPSRTFFDEIWGRFDQPDAWRIYEDATPALEELGRRGLKLAVISNWDKRLRPLLGDLKLSRHFAAIVISAEVGCRKPSQKIFRQAAGLLNFPPQSILHVGDGAEEDFAGAQAAGFQALLLDRHAGPAGGRRIGRLTELPALLA